MVLGRRVDYLSPTLFLTDILIILILASWKSKKIPDVRYILFVALFAAVNIYVSTSPWVALYKWVKVLEFFLLGVYIVQTKQTLSRVMYFLSIGVLFSSLLAIAQVVFQKSIGLWILGERTFTAETPGIARFAYNSLFTLRAYATLPHPNVLGGLLAVTLVLIAGIAAKGKRIFYIVVYGAGIIALVLTFSRSAWVAALVGIALVYKKKFLFLVIPLLFFIVSTIGFQDESVIVRKELGNASIAQFIQSPLVGVGLGNFLVELPNTLVSRRIYFLQPVHNMYLLALSETGLVGLGVFALFLFYVLKKPSPARPALILLLFLGLIDHYPLTLQQGQLLFTILLAESTIGS